MSSNTRTSIVHGILVRGEMIKFSDEEELRLVASEEDELKKPFELTGVEELELLELLELEKDFEIELLFLLDRLDENDLKPEDTEEAMEDLELFDFEEAFKSLLELAFLTDKLELFCEELLAFLTLGITSVVFCKLLFLNHLNQSKNPAWLD